MVTDMSANRWKYFRWTPRTAWITFVYVVAVPSVLYYVGFVSEVSSALFFGLGYDGVGEMDGKERMKGRVGWEGTGGIMGV